MRNKDVLKKLKNLPDNTKEYIDTNELVKVITDFELISTGKIAKIYTDNLTIGKRYRFPFESYPNVASAAIIKKYGDGTTKTLTTIRKSTDYIYVSAINGEKFDLYHRSAFGTMSRLNGSFGTTSSEYTSTFTKVVLDTLSDTLFEPTKDYHPATKKYVDDATNTLVKKDTNKYILITNDDTLVIKKASITDIANATVSIDNLTGKFGTLVANNDGTYSYTLNTIMTDAETFTFKVNNIEQKLVIVPYKEMKYDDSNAAINYMDGWSIEKNEKCYNGNIHVVTSSDTVASKANFEFVGTGIEVFSLINNQTGRIQVAIWKQKDDGTYPKTAIYRRTINTNYTYSDVAYGFPIISFDNNEYGKYKIEITVGKGETFYLDSICIHNPIYNLNLKIQNLYQPINENTNILYTNKHNPVFIPSRIYDPTTKKYVDDLVESSKTAMCTDEEIDNMLNEVLGGDYSGN